MSLNSYVGIQNKIHFVSKYVEDSTDDWFRVKKELIGVFSPKERKMLSRRHKTSKKFFINEFEKEIMALWKDLTKVSLRVNQDLLHQPSDERMPRHWALMQLNKKRQQQAQEKNEARR